MKLSPNLIKNSKYTIYSLVPLVILNQYRFFLNIYFTAAALLQITPLFRLGYPIFSALPLTFIYTVTVIKEGYEDYQRHFRDKELNDHSYPAYRQSHFTSIRSADLQVGDILFIEQHQRVPADVLLLKTTDRSGTSFIQTDQLDGETDWKLRIPVTETQKMTQEQLLEMDATIVTDTPCRDIHNFLGTFTLNMESGKPITESLSVDNVIWSDSAVATGSILALIIFAGRDTRTALNTNKASNKLGRIDYELEHLLFTLFVISSLLSLVLVGASLFKPPWIIRFVRITLIFSSIIPVNLRVNLEIARILMSIFIRRDSQLKGAILRNSSLPEELGRISYLFTDKTGTLTLNNMKFRRLHLGFATYVASTNMAALRSEFFIGMQTVARENPAYLTPHNDPTWTRNMFQSRIVFHAVIAMALCHTVTSSRSDNGGDEAPLQYQGASADEVALVRFTDELGVILAGRDASSITLLLPVFSPDTGVMSSGDVDTRSMTLERFDILALFPFSSETKRMGIVVRQIRTSRIFFYVKGADVVISRITSDGDWLEEDTTNMAQQGLRTIVYGMRVLSEDFYQKWLSVYHAAKISIADRDNLVANAISMLETNMELLGIAGLEDHLQPDVRGTLEMLKSAGIRLWMLTGDKVETAICVALSTRILTTTSTLQYLLIKSPNEAYTALQALVNKIESMPSFSIVTDGTSLNFLLASVDDANVGPNGNSEVVAGNASGSPSFEACDQCGLNVSSLDMCGSIAVCNNPSCVQALFVMIACRASSMICCRCTPTQKATIVGLVKNYTKLSCAAIGDGGNDISMIQIANLGIGLFGAEGKQAALAADVSVNEFKSLARLLLYHGRNSYIRMSRLSLFIIHRGLVIAFLEGIFIAMFHFVPISLYWGALSVGYSTIYTAAPVFSLVLDRDITSAIAMDFPELYKDLRGQLSAKRFVIWVAISLYQASTIMIVTLLLFAKSYLIITSLTAITFTSLILAQYLNIAFEIKTWHWAMGAALTASFLAYITSMFVLTNTFDISFILSFEFISKVFLLTAAATVPVYAVMFIKRKCDPPAYVKLL